MFRPAELRTILSVANPHLKAFTLLGINCAFGAKDCATLAHSHADGEWMEFPRVKTA